MKIGSAWNKTTKDKDGNATGTYISIALDETFLQLCPQLAGCNLSLSYISKEERNNEKSPHWSVTLNKRKAQEEAAASTPAPDPGEIPWD